METGQTPEQRQEERHEKTSGKVKRRGLIAGAAALVAGLVAAKTSEPVGATSGGGDQGVLNLGSNPWYNAGYLTPCTPAVSAAPTVIQASPNYGNYIGYNGADPVVFEVDARPAASGTIDGIYAFGRGSSSWGIQAVGGTAVKAKGTNIGVDTSGNTYGTYSSSNTIGVFGAGGPTGVYGTGTTYGVRGTSESGTGVKGEVSGSKANTNAVYGSNNSTGAGGVGVLGVSGSGNGVVGVSTGVGFGAIVGATNGVPGIYAAVFYGPTVTTGTKSAAVPHPDGSHRLLYCVEAPESWFEDFGEGKIVNGVAEVKLDPEFAAVVDTGTMHVFLTEHEDNHSLHVPAKTATGFTVQASSSALAARNLKASGVTSTFSYRVVAKRKDVQGGRLAKVQLPPMPQPPKQEDVPTPPPPTRPSGKP